MGTPDQARLGPEELAAIRARHVIDDDSSRDAPYCVDCIAPWPCDTVRCLAHIDAITEAVEGLRFEPVGDVTGLSEATRNNHGVMARGFDECRAAVLALLRGTPQRPDLASEYGRLLAERDRLIAQGVDPADLETPERPL